MRFLDLKSEKNRKSCRRSGLPLAGTSMSDDSFVLSRRKGRFIPSNLLTLC